MSAMRSLFAVLVAAFVVSAAQADCVSLFRDASGGIADREAAALDRSGDVFGVAKIDARSFAVYFAPYDSELSPKASDRLVAPRSFSGVTALVAADGEFGLFYQAPITAELMFQRISLDGLPIGAAVAVMPAHRSTTDREFDIVWEPRRKAYVVAHTVTSGGDAGVWLSTLNPDGSLRSEQSLSSLRTRPAEPQVTVAPDGSMLAIYRDTAALQGVVVGPDDAVVNRQRIMNTTSSRAAANDAGFLVIGTVVPTTTSAKRNELKYSLLDPKGALITAEKSFMKASGQEIVPVHLMWNADDKEWALSYLDSLLGFSIIEGEYRLRRFTSPTELLSDSPFIPNTIMWTYGTSMPFIWTGTSYDSVANRVVRNPDDRRESLLLRHCPLKAQISITPSAIAPGQVGTFSALTSGGTPGYEYLWDFGDGSFKETVQSIAHRYEKAGDFQIVLRVRDVVGATSTVTTTVKVAVPGPPPTPQPARRRAVRPHS